MREQSKENTKLETEHDLIDRVNANIETSKNNSLEDQDEKEKY